VIFSVATNKGGQVMGFPDVCKTPSPGGPVPAPYPNVALLNQASGATCSRKVRIQNKKVVVQNTTITTSTGDEAGSVGGVISNMIKGPAKPRRSSSTVRCEGKAAVFQTCTFGMNGNNANVPAGTLTMCAQMKTKVTR